MREDRGDSGLEVVAKGTHGGGEVGRILEEADGGYAGGTGGKACGHVFRSDSTNGENWDGDGGADFGEPVQALRRAEGSFGWRREDGAEEDVIGASGDGGAGRFQRMAGNADQKTGRQGLREMIRGEHSSCVFHAQGVLAKMNAAGLMS